MSDIIKENETQIEKLEKEKATLLEQFNATRNPSEKAELADKIKIVEDKIKAENSTMDKPSVVSQKEAPTRLDHSDKHFSRGDIVNSGETFKTII